MADVNIKFGTDDSLDKLKKDMADILKLVKAIKKADIIDDDEAVKAKKLAAEMLKASNALKKAEQASKGLADKQERANQKAKEAVGIVGKLEKETRDLVKARKAATDPAQVERYNKKLDETRKKMTAAKNTTASWSKALGSFQFKFNALGNIAANALSSITRGAKEFIREAIHMSLELEGVRNAFNKINDPALLGNLQKATRGMVNNLELMKGAVNAKNLNIPIEKLGTFFEFATNRSIETGESVNALVDDIVKGLGRKSVLILDNLGLSVIDINEEFKKTGNFVEAASNVIEREMIKAGKVVDTNLVLVKQMNTEYENLKLDAGTALQQVTLGMNDLLIKSADTRGLMDVVYNRSLRKSIKDIGDELDGIAEKAEDDSKITAQWIESVDEAGVVHRKLVLIGKESNEVNEEEIVTLTKLRQTLALKKAVVEATNIADREAIILAMLEVATIEAQIKAVEDLTKAEKERQDAIDERTFDDDSFIKKEIKSTNKIISFKDKSRKAEIDANDHLNSVLAMQNAQKLIDMKETADDEINTQKKVEEERSRLLKSTFMSALNLSNSLAELTEKNKQRELSAAGDNAAKRLEIEKEYAKKQQAISVSQAIINGAQAVTEVWKTWADNPILAGVFTALAVSTVGAQIAVIKKQKFAKGGFVEGPSHSNGGVDAELEGGESVINKYSTSKYKNLIEGVNEDDHLKIMMAMDKDRMMPTIKSDPYTKKLYDLMKNQETGYETPSYYVVNRGTTQLKLRKETPIKRKRNA